MFFFLYRVQECTTVNIDMMNKVSSLKKENDSLRAQLQELRQVIAKLTRANPGTTTGTVLMVIALSLSLFSNPSTSAGVATSAASVFAPAARALKGMEDAIVPTSIPTRNSSSNSNNFAALRNVLSSWLGLRRSDISHNEETNADAPLLLGGGRGGSIMQAKLGSAQPIDEQATESSSSEYEREEGEF